MAVYKFGTLNRLRSDYDSYLNDSKPIASSNKYDSIFGLDRETNTINPSKSILATTNKYDSIFGLDRKKLFEEEAEPELPVKKTSRTVGEVGKALGGSFAAGATNMIGTAIGSIERWLVQNTSGEGVGLGETVSNMGKNVLSGDWKQVGQAIKDLYVMKANVFAPWIGSLISGNSVKDAFSDQFASINQIGGSQAEAVIKQGEAEIRKWADVENESGLTQFFAGIAESTPSSLATRIPYVGWFLMGNQTYRNTLEQTKALYDSRGLPMPMDKAILKSMGYTAIEIGTEMLFPLFGKIGGAAAKGSLGNATKGLFEMAAKALGKKATKEVAELSFKTVGLAILKEAAGEGAEEVLAELGQAGVAMLTTNPDDPYWSWWGQDNGELTSLDALLTAFASGAVMGGGMTAVRGGAALAFKRANASVEKIADKPIAEVTEDEKQDFINAVIADFEANDNGEQEYVVGGLTNFITKVAVNQGKTLTTKTGKKIVIPTNSQFDMSKISNEAMRDVIFEKAKAQQATEQVQAEAPIVEQAPPVVEQPIVTPQAPVQQKSVVQSVVDASANFSKGMEPQTIVGYRVSYNAKQGREASVNVDTKQITLGRSFFAPQADRAKILTHEIAHSILKDNDVTGADIVATKLFGRLGAVNAEEAAVQILADIVANPNFVAEHPNMQQSMRNRYEYVAKFLPQEKQADKAVEPAQVVAKPAPQAEPVVTKPVAKTETETAPKQETKAQTETKPLWQQTRAEAVGQEPIKPPQPNPLSREFGKQGPSAEQLKEYNQRKYAWNRYLKELKAHVGKSNAHYNAIKEAIDRGETIQEEVMSDYPYLRKDTKSTTKPQTAQEYADSAEGKAEFAKLDNNPEKLANAVLDKIQDAVDNPKKFYHDKRFFENELEKYLIFSEKLKSVPKGQDVNRYIVHLLRAITDEKPTEAIKIIEKSYRDKELFHEIYTDKAALARAEQITADRNKEYAFKGIANFGIDHFAKELINSLTPESMPSKAEFVVMSQYITRLYEMPDGTGNTEAARLLKKLSSLMTATGQFIQAASMLKKMFPAYHAEQIIKAYEKEMNRDVPADDQKAHGEAVRDTMGVVKEVRKKAGKELRMNLSIQDLFANRIMASLEPREARVKTDVEKIVSNLFEKYRELVPYKKSGNEQTDMYRVLAELVVNRDKYKEYWQQAREIIYQNDTMNKGEGMARENFEEAQNFFTEITQVDFVKRIVNRTVLDTVRAMNTTVRELAQQFFVSGEESIADFADAVKKQVEKSGLTIDDASYKLMENYLVSHFRALVTQRHKQDIEAFANRMNRFYSKKTPMEDKERIIKSITKAAYYDVFADSQSRVSQIWADKLGLPVMTDDVKSMIYDYAAKYAQAKTDRARDEIYEELTFKLANNIPATMTEKTQAWLRTAMLFNPVTWVRNMLSNIGVKPFYHATDNLTNYFLHRMKNIPDDVQIAGERVRKYNPRDSIGKIVESESDDDTIKRIQAKSAKYSLAQLFGQERRIFKTKFLQTMSEIPYEIMSTGQYKNFKFRPFGDMYMFQKWYRDGMYNKLTALGFNESMPVEQKDAMLAQAREYAALLATMRTFRQANILSKIIRATHIEALKDKSGIGRTTYLLLKGAVPFVVTPAAIVSEVYKFSPLALAKAVIIDMGLGAKKWRTRTGEWKADYAKRVSQALTGTAFQFAVGAILSAAGLLTGAWPDDDDERKQWEAIGKRPYSIFIPGVGSISIDWAQPVATGLMIGAQSFEIISSADKSWIEKAVSPASATVDVLVNQTLLRNIFQTFGGGYGETPTTKVADLAQNVFFQGLPQILRKFNRVLDPYERNVYSGNAQQVFFNRILQSVPGGTFFIPKKIDVWGNEIKQTESTVGGAAGRFVLAFITPFTYSKDKMDDVTREVTRVFNETNSAKALPSVASKSISRTTKGVTTKWELDGKDYIEYQQAIGKRSYTEVQKLIASARYKRMTDDEKAKALGEIYSESVRAAGDAYAKAHPQK